MRTPYSEQPKAARPYADATPNVALSIEALAAGTALSIDRAALVELIRASSGRGFGFDVAARLPEPAAFAHGAKLLAKDVGLLRDLLDGHAAFAALNRATSSFLAAATA